MAPKDTRYDGDAVEIAWGLISNVPWLDQTQEWQNAAAQWRDQFIISPAQAAAEAQPDVVF